MKKILFTGIVSIFMAGSVYAGCSDPVVSDANTALLNKRITSGDWVEEHCSGAKLVKVGLGTISPTNQVDPSVVTGSWAASSTNGTVSYTYTRHGSAGPYEFTLHKNDLSVVSGDYYFCSGTGASASLEATGTISNESHCSDAVALPSP